MNAVSACWQRPKRARPATAASPPWCVPPGLPAAQSGGLADLDQPALPPGQVRRAGSGRKPVQEKDPTLLADLRRLVEPATLGDPMRPLLWVSKSHAKLVDALCAMGHPISPNTVGKLLREELGYSRQTNRKTLEPRPHPSPGSPGLADGQGSWRGPDPARNEGN